MSDIDIVIVNYKSAAHTINCVRAVHDVARADGISVSVVVVNNSDDGAELDPGVRRAGGATVISNPANVGFGAACNVGAQLGAAKFILFLNPDTMPQTGTLATMLKFMRDPANAGVGIVGPEIRDATGDVVRSCSRLPNAGDLIMRSVGLHVLFPNAGYPYLPLDAHEKSGPVGQVMGAAMMVRSDLFAALNGFDETFFLYYEDVDLCARAAAQGSKCYYLKDARVTHIGRASSSQDTGLSLALHVRSRLTYARRHFGATAYAALLLVCAVIEFPLRLVQAVVGRGVVSGRGVLRAYALLAKNLFAGAALPARDAS